MKSAVITSGEHWLTIDGIEYLRGTIETIEKLTYNDGKQAVKISGSSVNASVILVNGTTIDGTEVSSQSNLVDFIKQYAFRFGGGDGSGVTEQNIQEVLEAGDVVDQSLTVKNPNGESVLDLEGYYRNAEDTMSGNGYVRIRNGWINITSEKYLNQVTTLANVNSKGFSHLVFDNPNSTFTLTRLGFNDDHRLEYTSQKTVDGAQQNDEYLFPEKSGNDRQVVVWDEDGNMKAERLGWKHLSDLPSPPPFANGLYGGTAFQEDGSALFAFIQMNASGEPLANSIPLTDGQGSTPTSPATQTYHAVPLAQMTEALEDKVDKVEGQGLTPEPFTTAEKEKLATVEDPKFQGQFSSEAQLQANGQGGAGNYAYVDGGEGEPIHLYAWNATTDTWDLVAGESTAETPASVLMKYESNPDRNAFTDADRAKLDGIAAGAQVNLPATSIPTLNDVVTRNPFTDRSLHHSKNGLRVGLEDVPGIGAAFSADALGNSGFFRFDGEKWIALTNIGGANSVVFEFAGRANVNTPTEPENIATKAYVDSRAGGDPVLNTTTTQGVTTKEYANRFEYTCKIPVAVTVAAPPSNFQTIATNVILPSGVTIAGVAEHYISITNNNRAVIMSVFDSPTDRRININLWNVWTGATNVSANVFIKLVRYK